MKIKRPHFNQEIIKLLGTTRDKNLNRSQKDLIAKTRKILLSCSTSLGKKNQFKVFYKGSNFASYTNLTSCKSPFCLKCNQRKKWKAKTRFTQMANHLENKKILFVTLTLSQPHNLDLESSFDTHLLHFGLLKKLFTRFRKKFDLEKNLIFKAIETTCTPGIKVKLDNKKSGFVRSGLHNHIHLAIFKDEKDSIFEKTDLEISEFFYNSWLSCLKNELKKQAKSKTDPKKYYWLLDKTDKEMILPPAVALHDLLQRPFHFGLQQIA